MLARVHADAVTASRYPTPSDRGQMRYHELINSLHNAGKDPSRLIFEDDLTGLNNRRFLLGYFEHTVQWEADEHFPLSLALLDIDLFKSINDTYGHDAGDEALVFVAGLLKEVAGHDGYPVRLGGDEFMMLFPATDLEQAVAHARRLQQFTRERPLDLSGRKGSIRISLSIGVASAPADATNGNALIRQADIALYVSKKRGRNRVSLANEAEPEETAPKVALDRLEDAAVAGRRDEVQAVSAALDALSRGESSVLLIEGSPGMGKTTVIEAIRQSVAVNPAFSVVKISGRRQEEFRPYYLAGLLVRSLMSQRAGKAAAALDTLDARELHYLGQVLPSLDDGDATVDADQQRRRQGIFDTLVKFTTTLLDGKPLALLVDDLQYADEGTLVLLKVLTERASPPIFVCGAANDTLGGPDETAPPWERFFQTTGAELCVARRRLRPLDANDIRLHLSSVYPGIDLPPGFDAELQRTTSGNPLFLSEVLRMLVLDGKLSLAGQRWTVEPLEPGYLPRSLEEIVNRRIASLDERGRNLLEQISALGEDVALSVVTGATNVSENEVLEFLNRARSLGLLRTDFQNKDESMRFLGEAVREIVYRSIPPERRQELHAHLGAYQEALHQQRLDPSASVVAYHFKRAADAEKASRYDHIHDLQAATFDRDEAEHYSAEHLAPQQEEASREEKLSAAALAQLPNLVRAVVTAVRSVTLYPLDSQPVQKAYQEAFEAAVAALEFAEHVEIARSHGVLVANGHKMDVSDFRLRARAYLELLDRADLEGIDFRRGLVASEVGALLTQLGQVKLELVDENYWATFAAEQGFEYIVFHQRRYSGVRRRRARSRRASAAGMELGPEERSLVPEILRAILGAANSVKLYPLGSSQVSSAIDQLHEALSKVVTLRPAMTLASTDGTLLVNGAKAPSSGSEALSESVLTLFSASEIQSLTFLATYTRDEIVIFLEALKSLPAFVEPSFWETLARERDLQGLVFNGYYPTLVASVLATVERDPEEPEAAARALFNRPAEVLVETLPTVGKDLLAKGELALLRKVVRRVFTYYGALDVREREEVVRSCRALLDTSGQAAQHQFSAVAVDHALKAFRQEEDDQALGALATLLYQMTDSLLHFSDFTRAGRIFAEIRDRRRDLIKARRGMGPGFAVLNRAVDAATQALLMAEFQSKDPERQEKAVLVLESVGTPSISVLVEVIKQEKDLRTRQLAAVLLSRMGGDAAARLKQEVVLEVTSEQRLRILEVIDIVTRDLKTELMLCLSDVNAGVRRAAFRLSERLKDQPVLEVLVDLARNQGIGAAKGAIRSLATSPGGASAIVSTLQGTNDPEKAIACAQALARLRDPVAVPALTSVLTSRKFPVFGRPRWAGQVRATAAFALACIGGDGAQAVLKKVASDPDPRVRQIALHGVATGPGHAALIDNPDEEVAGDSDSDVREA
jgi:diguanylate cyclase (GGDEF)-like protein